MTSTTPTLSTARMPPRLAPGTRVLVTGATSGLGRNAVQWLHENGHHAIATGRDAVAGAALAAQGIRFRACDLTLASTAELESLLADADAVWHCAALSSPWGPAQDFQRINVSATIALAQAAIRTGVQRFVHISTPSLYFDFQHRYDVPETFLAARFANDYARSKHAAEQALATLSAVGPDTRFILLRPRAIFGPHDRVLLPRLLAQLKSDSGGVLKLPRGGAALLDMTYAGNVVHAMMLATAQPDLPNGRIYNISNHEPVRLADILQQLLVTELGLNLRIQSVPYPLLSAAAAAMEAAAKLSGHEPMLTRYSIGAVNFDMTLSPARAIAELAYRPPIRLADGVRLTARWLQARTPGGSRHG